MLRRLLEARFAGMRRVAGEMIDGLDDRSRLFILELAAEQQRLARLAVYGLGALIVSVLAVFWTAATLVALAWDTEWRHATLLGLLAFWIISTIILCLKARNLLKTVEDAFPLSRQVAADDFAQVRESLR
jgi:uncharacterized membrane protein YqjE